MARRWPGFEVLVPEPDHAMWFGSLAGIERSYRVMVEYAWPRGENDEMFRRFPVVRVLTPRLQLRYDAHDEAPLPHVYFDDLDPTLSPLCLFDPAAGEWSRDDLISETTIPWAADWLACYEGWVATGRWYGGGRHAQRADKEDAA
jgi:hypothetical protein